MVISIVFTGPHWFVSNDLMPFDIYTRTYIDQNLWNRGTDFGHHVFTMKLVLSLPYSQQANDSSVLFMEPQPR